MPDDKRDPSRRLVGYAVRDSTSTWACHPSPKAKPCYNDDVRRRYIWKGAPGERKARAFIRYAEAAHVEEGDDIRYCLVAVFRVKKASKR